MVIRKPLLHWLAVLLLIVCGVSLTANILFAAAPSTPTFPIVHWPNDPNVAADCTDNCVDWLPYTALGDNLTDPRTQDPSNGGTSPQNYVNVASSCIDENDPSVYWSYDNANDVIFFRWRVEQIPNTYATGPSAGSHAATDPWKSALWTVMFDIDGDGFREFAIHLDGSSGSPANAIDRLYSIYSDTPSQSIDYLNDPNIHLLTSQPTALVDPATNRIYNYNSTNTPTTIWPNGSSETIWDYGPTRSTKITGVNCEEYFIDYQIPLAMLDASSVGGPTFDDNTPFGMFYATANSLNNPSQKDAVANGAFTADPSQPFPVGDTVTPATGDPNNPGPNSLPQPQVTLVNAANCPASPAILTANVADALNLNGTTSVASVEFFVYYDANANEQPDDGGVWTSVGNGTNTPVSTWTYAWDSTTFAKGRYLVGVQATDAQGNKTYSYLTPAEVTAIGGSQNFANPSPTPGVVYYSKFSNNICGVAPSLSKSVDPSAVSAGETVTFTLTVQNPTPSVITLSTITDSLPSGFTFGGTASGGTLSPTSSPSAGASGVIGWDFSPAVSIPASGSGTLIFTTTAPAIVGTYANVAQAATSQGLLDADPAQVSVGPPRLTLAKAASPISLAEGELVTYTITYGNDSSVNITGVVISDTLPTGLDFEAALDGGTYNAGTKTITWNIGALNSTEGPFTVRFVGRVTNPYPSAAPVPLVNTALIDSDETDPTSASTKVNVDVPRPEMLIQKRANNVLTSPGGTVIYTIEYENVGNASALSTVITDTLPVGFSFSSASNSGAQTAPGSGIVVWDIGTVPAGGSGSVTLTATVANPFSAANPALNTATIDTAATDPVSDSYTVGVITGGTTCTAYFFRNSTTNVGNAGTQKIANTTAPTSGTATTSAAVSVNNAQFYEVARFYQDPAAVSALTLASPVTATLYVNTQNAQSTFQVELFDYNPADGTTVSLGSGNTGTANGNSSNAVVTASFTPSGTLQAGHRLLWVIRATKNSSGPGINVSLNFDGASSRSSSGVCITAGPALALNKQVSDQSLTPGQVVSYTIQFGNLVSTATGAVLTDTLPAGMAFQSATLNGAAITPSGSYVFTVRTSDTATAGQLSAGQSGTLIITATVNAPLTDGITTLQNQVRLTANAATPVTDTATSAVVKPELTILKDAKPTLLAPGDVMTYTFTVLNTGNATASNVTISDALPSTAYFAYVSGSTLVNDVTTAPISTNPFRVNIGSLGPNGTAVVTLRMQVLDNSLAPDGTTLLGNTAAVSSTLTAIRSSDPVTVSITTSPILRISKATSGGSLGAGDTITYTLQITNAGSSTAQNVLLTDPILANASYLTSTLIYSGTTQTDIQDSDAGEFDPINNRIRVL